TPKQSANDRVNVLQMFGTSSGDANYRTQIDVTNTSTVAVPIEVSVIDPVTAVVYGGAQSFTVAPKSLLRVGRILETVGAPLINGLRVTVAIKEGTTVPSGGVIAVASTLDNRSQDQYAFVGMRQSGTVVPAEMLPVQDVPYPAVREPGPLPPSRRDCSGRSARRRSLRPSGARSGGSLRARIRSRSGGSGNGSARCARRSATASPGTCR